MPTATNPVTADRAASILATWGDDVPFARPTAVAWALRCEGLDHDEALVDALVQLIAARG